MLSLLVIFIPFCLLGALSVFLITANEFEKHGFQGRRLFWEAFQSALVAFFMMLGITLLASWLFMQCN